MNASIRKSLTWVLVAALVLLVGFALLVLVAGDGGGGGPDYPLF
jgi:hypothetical protein